MGPRRSKIRQTFDRDLGAALNSLQTSCHVGDLFQKPSGIGNVLGICVFQCITSALSAKMMESLMDQPAEPLQPDTMLGFVSCCHTGGGFTQRTTTPLNMKARLAMGHQMSKEMIGSSIDAHCHYEQKRYAMAV